jgi:hypothetical protein
MSEVNKIANYNQMMSWLTRPSTPQTETRENFAEAGSAKGRFSKDTNKGRLREYLNNLSKGSTINRQELIKKFNMEKAAGSVSEVLNEFPNKFNFINPVKGVSKGPQIKATQSQKNLAPLLFDKEYDELTINERSKITSGKFDKNTMTPIRRAKMYDPIALRDFGKKWSELTEKEKERLRDGKGPVDPNRIPTNKAKVQKELLELSKDPEIMDIFKNPNRTKSQYTKDLTRVKKILGKDTNAVARLTQLASAILGDTPVPGISTELKEGADVIYNNLPHTKTQRDLDELKIGKSVGEKSIKTTKSEIRKSPGYVFSGDYNIDEVGGATSSVRRGTTPYGIFGQIIDRDINKKDKMSFDGNKSKKEKALQDAIKTKNPKLINEALRDFNKLVSDYEQKINKDIPKGDLKVRLFKASLDSPKNTIKNFDNFNPEYKKAFLNNYKNKGYSFNVPKDIKTIPQIAQDVQNPKIIQKIGQRAEAGSARLYSKLLPGLEQIAQGIKNIPDDIAKKKYFTLGLKALGPLGTYIAVDDTYEALKAGRPVAEALEYGLIGTNLIGSAKDLMALSPEEREARSVVKQAEMADQIAQDESMLDSDFETPKVKSDLTREEAEEKFEAAKARRKLERESQEADIAKARAISMSGLKDLITGKRFAGQEIPTQYMAAGGRMGFADGPDDPSRRKFMKIAGGIASIPLVGKYLKPAMVAAPKVVEVVKRSADGIPEFIGDLVTKVVSFGKKNFTGNRADEFADQYRLDDYVVTQQGNKTTIQKFDDPDNPNYKEYEIELETDPETGGVTYNEASVRPDAEGKLKDVEEYVDDLDLEDMRKYTYDE